VIAGKLSGWYTWFRDSGRHLASLFPTRQQSAARPRESVASMPLRLGRFR
jgi:hypothetical protein